MKHLLRPSMLTIALTAIGCLFYACSDEEIDDVSPQETDFTVRAKNGYLEFKDQATFDKIKSSLEDQDNEAIETWENQFKEFSSLRSVDENSIDAQEAWFDQLRNMSENDRVALSQSDDDFWYSEYIKSHKSAFILEDSGIYHLNISAIGSELLSFLNQNGVLKVGNELRMYKDNSLKIIRDGDESKLKMLSEMDEDNENLQIFVFKDIIQTLSNTRADNGRQALSIVTNQSSSCQDVIGRQRVIGQAYISSSPVPDGSGFYTTYAFVGATNYNRDGIFGGYTRKRTRFLRIEGNLTAYIDGVSQGSTGNITVTTGGRLRTRIDRNFFIATHTFIDRFQTEVSGTLNVFGRGGTRCGDHGLLPEDKWY